MPRDVNSPALWRNFWGAGHAGVTLFFVLSGFVLVYTYGPVEGTRIDARSFWGARVARLYPVYIAALIIALPEFVRMIAGLPGVPPFTRAQTIVVAASTPLMLQAWLTGTTCRWNCPGWTLSVEAFFYLLFPLMAPLLRGRSARTLLVISLVAVAVTWAISSATLGASSGDGYLARGVFPHAPVYRLPEFVLGMAMGRWYLDRRSAGILLRRAAGRLLTLASTLSVVGVAATYPRWGDDSLVFSALVVPLAGLILAAAEGGGGILAWPVFGFLGEASYAFYIIHGPLHVYVLGAARRLVPGSITEHPWSIFWVYLGTVLIGSVLLYTYLERPARQALRRRLAHGTVSA